MSTIIIGGGISGLACARRLRDAGHSFHLVTDRIGGRMHHRPDGTMNFGATYINEDYHHVSRFVKKGQRFRLREAQCEQGDQLGTLFHWRNLRHLPAAIRLVRRLHEFRGALKNFRREAQFFPQKDLLARHPLIARLVQQPATDLIKELGIGKLNENYFQLAFRATCFVNADQANAFFYLGVLFPIIVPTWVADFRGAYEGLTNGYQDRIIQDKAVSMIRGDNGWTVECQGGKKLLATNIVMAAPYHNAKELYPVPKPNLLAPATIFSVRGKRHPKYSNKRFVLLRPQVDGLELIWNQANGEDLLFCTVQEPNLGKIYEEYTITEKVEWKTAIVVSNGEWTPLNLEPNLFLVGDYNLCGMEDSYITGLCAANRILGATPEKEAIHG